MKVKRLTCTGEIGLIICTLRALTLHLVLVMRPTIASDAITDTIGKNEKHRARGGTRTVGAIKIHSGNWKSIIIHGKRRSVRFLHRVL